LISIVCDVTHDKDKNGYKQLTFYYIFFGDQEADNEKHKKYEQVSVSQMSFSYPIWISV